MPKIGGVLLVMWHPLVLLGIALLGLLCFQLWVQATTSLLASETSPATLNGQEISVTSQGIQIRVKERPLLEILQDIQNLSGTDFSLSSEMGKISIRAFNSNGTKSNELPVSFRRLGGA